MNVVQRPSGNWVERWIDCAGITLRVVTGGQGMPVLLIHGFTSTGDAWLPFFPELTSYYQVVAVDVVGHGRSAAPTDPYLYRMERTVDSLLTLMERLAPGQTFACVGYSMGGRIALGTAVSAPDRVRGLLLESASPGLASETERAQRRCADNRLAERIEAGGIAAFVDEWENLSVFATQKRLPASVAARQREIRLGQRPLGLANSLRGIGTGEQPSYWAQMSKLRMPIRLVTGQDDAKFTSIARAMTVCCPHAQHVLVAGAGHAVHLEQPEVFGREMMSFLGHIAGQRLAQRDRS